MRSILGPARRAALHGALGLSTFGLAEAALGLGFSALFPAWVPREATLTPLTLLSALAYPALGAVMGLAIGLAVQAAAASRQRREWTAAPSREAIEAVVMLFALALLALTLASGGDAGRRTVWLCAAGSLGLALASVARAVRPTHRLAVLGSPWFVALAITGVLHLSIPAIPRGEGRGAVLAAAAWLACLAGAALLSSWRSRSLFSTFPGGGHAVAWLCLVACAWTGDDGITRADASVVRQARSDAPNVVVISMDTVRRDHLSAYGYERPTTPHLEALAGEATRYTAAISTGNMTLTSHGSIFTGRYPSSHGAIPPAHPLPTNVPTLAEQLREAGYRTGAIVSNHAFLHPSLGFDRGFDYYDSRLPGLRAALRPLLFPRDAIVAAYRHVAGEPGPRTFYRQAGDITREAVQWIEAASAEKRPFLLFLNYMDAHTPYAAPEPYASRFARTPDHMSWHAFGAMKRAIVANERRMTDDERRTLIDAYDAGIAYADAEIGRMLDALRARGLYDDTLVIVTADHGEAFDEHGVVEHGVSLFEHQIGVPLIVKLPADARDGRGEQVVRDPVSGADLMPTILEVAGEAVPAGVEGRSLLHLDVDAREAPRHIFAEAFPDQGGVVRAAFAPDGRKLLVDDTGARLFDVAADPGEEDDVWSRFPSDAARMIAVLDATFERVHPRAMGRRRPAATAAADAEVLHRLRSLGYVK